ncbi:MAG: hydroxymethylbilane synthase [Propionibacteriaceae bacterium]
MNPPVNPAADRVIRIGARRSPLAVAQADWVAARLNDLGVATEVVGLVTTGDTDRRHLTEIGGTGVFATAVREAVLAGHADLAVHSLKDLPTAAAPGLLLAAVPTREDTRDVLVGRRLDAITDGVRIGTGSPRRAVQLTALARERGIRIDVAPIRGNVDTRLGLVRDGEVDAIVLAAAGLRRLGRLAPQPSGDNAGADSGLEVGGLPAEVLDHAVMIPAPGQGALGLEVAEDSPAWVRDAVARLDDPAARAETLAERGFLSTLEAGCLAPVGAAAIVKSVHGTSADLTMAAVIGRTLGKDFAEAAESTGEIRLEIAGPATAAAALGRRLAEQGLARIGSLTEHN